MEKNSAKTKSLEKIPLGKTIRINQLVIGGLALFHVGYNIIGNLLVSNNLFTRIMDGSAFLSDWFFLLEYIAVATGGILLFQRNNYGIYPVFIGLCVDFIFLLIFGLLIGLLLDIVVIVICIFFFIRLREFKKEGVMKRNNSSLKLK